MIVILMKAAKLAPPDLLKKLYFEKKGNDVIICVQDVSNKILSRHPNYIVDVVMWPKFGNFNHGNNDSWILSIRVAEHSLSKSLSWFPLHIKSNDTRNDATGCKKSFWVNRNGSKRVFRLIDFPEFIINHGSKWGFQINISKILGHHNQGRPRNISFKLFL